MISIPGRPTGAIRTLPHMVRSRAEDQPDEIAFVFLRDGEQPTEQLTYRELDRDMVARAAGFRAAGLSGRTVILLYPSGLEFVRTLLGAMHGRVTGVPAQVPRKRQGLARLRRIAADAGTTTVLTTAEVRRELAERFAGLPEFAELNLVATDALTEPAGAVGSDEPRAEDVAMLQYTSGSTGDPKGVMVTHANFVANAVETDVLWTCGPGSVFVSWLPLFHDMGMLFSIVVPIWFGCPAYLMTPDAFIRRPARWLEAISRFCGTHSAAPSFAYDLCVRAEAAGATTGVGDLSSWRVAANGAEPVRWHTVRAFTEAFAAKGFRSTAMSAGYGLAENTLKATGSGADDEPRPLWLSATALGHGRVEPVDENHPDATVLVSNGSTVLDTKIMIMDPDTLTGCPPGRTGEIWISGPCVAAGYHGRPALSEETFRARPSDKPPGGRTYLRTGDLGFLHHGQLYVTGRRKDVIVRKGRNYYPQDIELSAESSVPGLHTNCAVAFSVDDGVSEHLVLAIEADGRVLRTVGADELRERVRDVVADNNGLTVDDLLILRRGALPKTSSGKVQRAACRARYERGELTELLVSGPVGVGESR